MSVSPATHQERMKTKLASATRTEMDAALMAATCLGERLLRLAISANLCTSDVKFISHPFYGSDAVHAELLTDLPDMHVDGAVPHNDVIPPNLVENFIS